MPKIRQGTSQINFKNSASIGRVFTPVASGPPVNLITNPSFTTNTTGWSSNGGTSRNTTNYKSAPASLYQTFDDGYSAFVEYSGVGVLTVGQVYSLSIWIKGSPLQVTLTCGGNQVSITPPTTADFTNYKIENVSCTSNGNLQVVVGSGDTNFYIDDVSVVLGPTALVL